jgi:cysteine desulfurase
VIWVGNETGVVSDPRRVVERARALGALSHSDGVQALGRVPVDFAATGLDLLSLSAHKVGGPVGVGALIVRRGVRLPRVDFGGGQESDLRSGTVPVALASGFAAALRSAVAELDARDTLMRGWHDRVIAAARELGGYPNCSGECVSAIVNVTFPGTRADDTLLLLDRAGVAVSAGSACASGVHQASEALLAMGRSPADAAASLRVSFGWSTTEADVDALLRALPDAVSTARRSFG